MTKRILAANTVTKTIQKNKVTGLLNITRHADHPSIITATARDIRHDECCMREIQTSCGFIFYLKSALF